MTTDSLRRPAFGTAMPVRTSLRPARDPCQVSQPMRRNGPARRAAA